ncbi:MAG: hypothetical protein JWL83_1512 [Actinomycetia bacterium]|nr:hypothetical protein [Actinomycetes bacterium]
MPAAMPTDASSADAVKRLEAEGYTGRFLVRPGGIIECGGCQASFNAGDARIEQLQRFEGNEDPDDGEVVVAVVCPRCGERGVLVLGYGPAANPDDQDVLASLQDGRA